MAISRAYTEAVAQFDQKPSAPPWRDLSTLDRAAIAEQTRRALRR